jgi:hypothetical protein
VTLTPELLDNLADNAKQWRDLAEELNGLVTSRPANDADQQEQCKAPYLRPAAAAPQPSTPPTPPRRVPTRCARYAAPRAARSERSGRRPTQPLGR